MLVNFFFTLAAFIATFDALAQVFEIRNLTVSDENSKTIYIGIHNKFKVPDLTAIPSAASKKTKITLKEDTLDLVPNFFGTEILTFHAKNGIQQVSFTIKRMPDMFLWISGSTDKSILKKEFLKAPQFSLAPNDLFFKDFFLDSTILELNGKTFQINNGVLPNNLIPAIEGAKNGDRLEINYLRARSFRSEVILVKKDKTDFTLK